MMLIRLEWEGVMSKGFVSLSVVILLWLVLSQVLYAQSGKFCLEKAASEIKLDKEVVLINRDGNSIKGRLVSFDLPQSSIVISRFIDNYADTSTFMETDIAKIKYRKAKVKPGYMLLGFFGGMMTGLAVGGAVCSSGWEGMDCGLGIFFGGTATGLMLGTFLPLVFPGYKTIECKPDAR
jgi:hypothetical protein